MTHRLVAATLTLLGFGFGLPAVAGWIESAEPSPAGIAMLVLGASLLAIGLTTFPLGSRLPTRRIPGSLALALMTNALFLALFALEISHGLVREDGVIAKSLAFFPPALLIYAGMLKGRRWSWHAGRWSSLLFAILYLGVAATAAIVQPVDAEGGPIWLFLVLVSATLGGALWYGGFHALGRPSARLYFNIRALPTESYAQGLS
jgi:hypothetical protein